MTAASTGAPARKFCAADTRREGSPTVGALRRLRGAIAGRTGGRDRIQVFHSRQPGEEKRTIEQTRAGAIDLNRIHIAPIGTFAPATTALEMPN